MNKGISSTFATWRFLLLTLLIGTFLMTAPLIGGKWQIQMLLEVLLLVAVLVTVSANPGWHKLRWVMVTLWVVSVTGTLLSVFSVRPTLWQWYRSIELLTVVPVLAVVAAGMLAFVRRQHRLTIDSIFATVAAYLLLALLFTQLYLCLIAWDPASFSLPIEAAGRPRTRRACSPCSRRCSGSSTLRWSSHCSSECTCRSRRAEAAGSAHGRPSRSADAETGLAPARAARRSAPAGASGAICTGQRHPRRASGYPRICFA